MKTENNILSKVNSAIALFAFLLVSYSGYGQCNLACNSNVQVSLDDDCSVMIMPDMVLEGTATATCTYSVELEMPNGTSIPNATVTSAHIGMTITAKVTDQTGNSCWGSILVEDKLAPVLTCPSDVTVQCYQNQAALTPAQFIAGGYMSDNCGNATVSVVSDVLTDISCTDTTYPNYSAIRVITYIAEDASGNVSNECSYNIFYERVNLYDGAGALNITWPSNQNASCSQYQTWPAGLNGMGVPVLNGTAFGIFPNTSYCELNATYTDVIIDLCGAEYKVIREWTVLDWCTGETANHNQIIKIEQGTIGFTSNAGCSQTGITDAYSCGGSYQIPSNFLNLFGLCNGVSYSYETYILTSGEYPDETDGVAGISSCDCANSNPGIFTQVGGTYTDISNPPNLTGLSYGCNWVKVVLTTECNQTFETSFEVLINDTVAPNPVCDQHTVVTVGNNGWAIANATSFDDGSFDFCSDVSFGVRRLSGSCNVPGSPAVFGSFGGNTYFEYEKFCCSDIGAPVMVEMVVVDESGNWNVCTVEVIVQDISSLSVTCPVGFVSQSRSCGQGPASTSGPTLTSAICTNYYVDGPSDSNYTPDDCGDYSLVRTWNIRNSNTNQIVQTCTQNINVTNTTQFNGSTIGFPGDQLNLTGCINADTSPSTTGSPNYNANSCSLVADTYTDQTFNFVDGACFKILRTWTVIDWCQYDANNPGAGGIWQHVQVIKVNDNTAPNPIAETVFIDITSKVGCVAQGSVSVDGNDNCGNLSYSYSVNGGSFSNPSSNNSYFSNNWTEGTHTVTWLVEDACGNSGTVNQTVVVDDKVAPTPYCLGAITTVLMESTGTVTIWASDYDPDGNSTDNCDNNLTLYFGNGSSSLTFDCDDLGVQLLQVYFEDDSGNADFCTVTIDIQDNAGACSGTRIAGEVYSEMDEMLDDVEVNLHNMFTEVDNYDMTASGEYFFTPVTANQNYEISASKDDDYMNGVSTLDLVLIQKHLLNTQMLNSPYKVMAADINNSGNLTAIDLVELRKLILGIFTELPNNESWRFVDANQTFANVNQPWPFTEVISVNQFTSSLFDQDFVAIKIGDVNNTAVANVSSSVTQNRSDESLDLYTEMNTADDLITISFKAENYSDIIGWQTTLNIAEGYEFASLTQGALAMTDAHINPSTEGKLAVSYNSTDGQTLLEDEVLFSINLRAKTNNNLHNPITIGSDLIETEAYTSDLEVLDIILIDDRNDLEGFEVFQNTPNPFSDNTTISFNLAERAFVTISIYDVTGRSIMELNKEFNKGFNTVNITGDELKASGVMYYRIDAGSSTATKKMISL